MGWGITPFDGGCYIRRAHLREGRFRPALLPGLCPYKLLYVRMTFCLPHGKPDRHLGWLYWLPNPLLPFIWYRVALPRDHPSLLVEIPSR